MDFIDPQEVEELLDGCLARMRKSPDSFTAWEREFLTSLEQRLDIGDVPSGKQWDKLQQIYEDKA